MLDVDDDEAEEGDEEVEVLCLSRSDLDDLLDPCVDEDLTFS